MATTVWITLSLALLAHPENTARQIQSYNFDFDDNVFSTKARVYLADNGKPRELLPEEGKYMGASVPQ